MHNTDTAIITALKLTLSLNVQSKHWYLLQDTSIYNGISLHQIILDQGKIHFLYLQW